MFNWQCPKSEPSLITAVAAKARSEVLSLRPSGSLFEAEALCWPLPVAQCSRVAAVFALSQVSMGLPSLDPDSLTWHPDMALDVPCHCGLAEWTTNCCWPWPLSCKPVLTLACCSAPWLLGEVTAFPCLVAPLDSQTHSLAELPSLAVPWHLPPPNTETSYVVSLHFLYNVCFCGRQVWVKGRAIRSGYLDENQQIEIKETKILNAVCISSILLNTVIVWKLCCLSPWHVHCNDKHFAIQASSFLYLYRF